MTGRMRKFGAGMRDGSGYAAGVRLGNAKSAKWLARKSGGRCMTADADDPGEVEGGKARPNLGRPGRRAFKAGGRIERAGGGPATLKDVPEIAKAAATGAGGSMAAKIAGRMAPSKLESQSSKDQHDQAAIVGAKGVQDDAEEREGRKHGGKVAKHDSDHDEDDGYAKGGFLKGIKKGALRSELHVKSGEKIPAKKLDKATHSSNPLLKKRAVLAQNMKSWNHK